MENTKSKQPLGSAAWGFRALKLPRQLALAAKYGMAYHELGIANADTDIPLDATAEDLETVKRLYREHGISLQCAATGCDFTGPDAPEQVRKVLRVMEICEAVGAEKLRVFAGFTPLADMTEERWSGMLQSLRAVAKAAYEKHITLCVETHGAVEPMLDGVRHIRSTTTQVEDIRRILDAADVKLVFDPANLHAVGEEDLEGFFEAVKDRIGYIHLKDFRHGPQGQLYPCALGEGGTKWEPLAKKMLSANVPLLFEYENCEDLEDGLHQCITCWKGETTK